MKRIKLILSILLTTSAIQAQQVTRLSLSDCMEYALKNNYQVKNAHLDALILEAQTKQTTSAAYPHINFKGDGTHFNIPQYSYIGASSFSFPGMPTPKKDEISAVQFTIPYMANGAITASQLLFDGSVIVALQAKNTAMELGWKAENVTKENVRYNVYKAYNSLVIAYRQYDIIKSSLALVRSMEHDLEVMRKNGFVEKIEVERTTVQLNNLATDSLRVSNMLIMAEQALKFNLGMNINTPIVLTDTAIEKNQSEAMRLASETGSIENVPEYDVLMTTLKLNEFNLKRHKLAALPSLSGVYQYGANIGGYYFKDLFYSKDYNVYSMFGLSLTTPIFNGFVRQHQVSEAKLNIEKTKNNIDNLKLAIDFQSSSARTNLKNSLLQVQSQKRNLELANDVLALAQKKYKAGVGSNLEVTSAQTELLRSQNSYFTAMLDVINAEADLRKALGLLK
ncbi:MAG: TolC family protein [Flavipsychrobacter sp.]|jgi:outer membrane protein TolC|nr:TolC family protein [Flavipsychrobacter sp.]